MNHSLMAFYHVLGESRSSETDHLKQEANLTEITKLELKLRLLYIKSTRSITSFSNLSAGTSGKGGDPGPLSMECNGG